MSRMMRAIEYSGHAAGKLALAGLLVIAMASCASSSRGAHAPAAAEASAPPADPRSEIDRLWNDIERLRSGQDADYAPSAAGAAEADDEDASVELMEPAAEPASAADRAAGTIVTSSARRQPAPDVPLVCPDGSDPPFATCGDSCRIARSICNNAESICRLAGELPGDAWAAGKCTGAREACGEATEACCNCAGE